MKKSIICAIPMKEKVERVVYTSSDSSLPAWKEAVRYPVNAFLAETLESEDELKVIMITKKDGNGYHEDHMEQFKGELEEVNRRVGAKIEYAAVDTDFSQERAVHESLIGRIIEEIDDGNEIIADVTYGPKDLPIVIFTALNFAEKFLGCKVENIIYGQASFRDGQIVNTELCDMVPLYCLSSITSTVKSAVPDKARAMLKTLLSL